VVVGLYPSVYVGMIRMSGGCSGQALWMGCKGYMHTEFLLEHPRTSPRGRPDGSFCVCILKSCVQRVLNKEGFTGHKGSVRIHCMSTAMQCALI